MLAWLSGQVLWTLFGQANGKVDDLTPPALVEDHLCDRNVLTNPVITSAHYAYEKADLVKLNRDGVVAAAQYIQKRLLVEKYTPHTWRTNPMHICPPLDCSPTDERCKPFLDWIFLISSLNFSFWSERSGQEDRYGVEWRAGWGSEQTTLWTGYWSLVAALNRALEANIPITDPMFYSSPTECPDELIADTFRAADRSSESIPLLKERIEIMRDVGRILCAKFGGSFQGFIDSFLRRYKGRGTALELVQMVTDEFPSFRDEVCFEGRQVVFWKRAQILVAETWAALYPDDIETPHPLFPQGISQLTMFADYRVPQILHHLKILTYPSDLTALLKSRTTIPRGSREEISIRAASILAVEAIKEEMLRESGGEGDTKVTVDRDQVCSVMIDFYLWDLAKKVEDSRESIDGIQTTAIIPAHETRSIWY